MVGFWEHDNERRGCTKPITAILPTAGLLGRHSYVDTVAKCLPAYRDRVPTTRVPGHSTKRMRHVTISLVRHSQAPKCVLVMNEN